MISKLRFHSNFTNSVGFICYQDMALFMVLNYRPWAVSSPSDYLRLQIDTLEFMNHGFYQFSKDSDKTRIDILSHQVFLPILVSPQSSQSLRR